MALPIPHIASDRVYIRDLSMPQAQSIFICDRIRFGPTYVEQLFRFARLYARYCSTGAGTRQPFAAARAAAASDVRFKLETKILPAWHPPRSPDGSPAKIPAELLENHTADPQRFVDALCGAIERGGMTARADVQSFDFKMLLPVAVQHPNIPTCYLTENAHLLSTDFVPAALRTKPEAPPH